MSTIKSSAEDLTLNADGSNEVKFQINAVEKASINSSGLFTSTTIDATALTTVPVNKGGTGATTHTANNVLVGNGTSAVGSVAPSTSGNVLTSNGTSWASTAPAGGGFTLATPQATTSGTTFTFSSIPAGTTMIIIHFDNCSLSGSNGINVQIGDAGGIETSGYLSGAVDLSTSVGATQGTSGFFMDSNYSDNFLQGHMILALQDASAFTWTENHSLRVGTGRLLLGGGAKSLSAELTQLKILTDGANTWDSGSVNISYQ